MKRIKITKEGKAKLKEVVKKHGILKERSSLLMTFLGKLLGWQIQKALKNDKDFQTAVADLDDALIKAKAEIQDLIDQGYDLPPDMKKWARDHGMKVK